MANHNYSQYSNKKRNNGNAANSNRPNTKHAPEKPSKPVEATPEVKMVVETVDTVPMPKTVEGVVTNCNKLNVRAEPSVDAEVLYVLDVMSEIKINVNKSDNEWFNVCTASGIEGYCMRKFVDAYL